MTRYRIGIDTGGTFTDVVAIDDDSGQVVITKTPSTPDDPSVSLLEGIEKIRRERPGEAAGIYHGTTVATNALLEERFQSLGLITTRGFRHVLEIARQSVPSGYGNSYFWVKPDRIVPLHRVAEVTERLDYHGKVLVPFDEHQAREVARSFRRAGINAIAVCFIHAYANGDHERRMRRILAEEHPEASVSISSEVLPEYREYERTVTTVIDAHVKPLVRAYVERVEEQVPSIHGARGGMPFLIMQSNGGVMSASAVTRQPITTLLSGPAAGALGASWLAALAGFRNVLTVDAGGTSTDICVVEDGEPQVTTEGQVGRFPVKIPMIDITTIGTGGGSIAWIDQSGGIRVGPRSAGASPGPMCYPGGGDEPALTDANLVLGRLPPHLLGGEIPLDVERATFGLGQMAGRLGLSTVQLAAGVVEIADWNQVNAIRRVTVKKGLDPRAYVMVPFGGSGPLQAARVAQLLCMPSIMVPPHPGNVSALGLLAVDLKADYVATLVQREESLDAGELNEVLDRLENAARRDMIDEGVPDCRRRFARSADVRYQGQAYELRIEMLPGPPLDAQALAALIDRFHAAHERLYGYCYRDTQPVELVNLRVTAIGATEKPVLAEAPVAPFEAPESEGDRPVYFDGRFIDCPIFRRDRLGRGTSIAGPAIVEEFGATTVVQPAQTARVDRIGNLIISPTAH